MIYIKLETELEESSVKFKFIKNKIFNIKNKFVKLKEEIFENIVLISIPNIEKQTLNKLSRYIKIKCINRVCLSDNLLEKIEIREFLKNENVNFFDGKWLFQHMIKECVEYVCICKKEEMVYQEITLLSNNINNIIKDTIIELSSDVRVLNIVTENENKFKRIEKELYEEKGIILNITNNYEKSLSKSNIIFNFDFSEEEINKYNIPRNACIINLCNQVKINKKAFEGINANFYDIQIPRKYLKNSIYLNGFNNSILYESYIYKNTNPQNIKKEIKNDGVNILFLNGINGKIRKNEYLNLSKKIAN